MSNKEAELEGLLYVAGDNGLKRDQLVALLKISQSALRELASHLQDNLVKDNRCGLQLVYFNETYKLLTRPEVGAVIETYFQKDFSKTLSQSALEILAIIAYRQPITRLEIDDLRGVNSSGALQTLIWRGLVMINGKKEVVGRPNLYGTTDYFLQYFGYHTLADLPVIESFDTDGLDEQGQVDLFHVNEDEMTDKQKKEKK